MEKLKTTISLRQVSIYLFFTVPLFKLLIFPSLVFHTAFRDSLFVLALLFAVDLLVYILAVSLIKQGISLKNLVISAVGTGGAKILAFCYGLYFLVKTFLPFMEQVGFVATILYDNNISKYFFVPVIFLLCYGAYKGSSSVLRVVELLFPFVLFSILAITTLSITESSFEGIFPILEFGVTPVFKSAFAHSYMFSNFLPVVFIMRKVEDKQNLKKTILPFVMGFVLTMFLFFLVLGIYGVIAPRQTFFIAKISKYSTAFSNFSRFDLFFILTIYLGMTAMLCFEFSVIIRLFRYCFNIDNSLFPAVILGLVLFVLLLSSYIHISSLVEFLGIFMPYLAMIFHYALPFAFIIMGKAKQSKLLLMEVEDVQ